MNIWLIQTGESLPIKDNIKKMRTAFLADKLIEKGHSVLWWASAFDHLKKNWISKKDIIINRNDRYKIFTLKGIGYKKNISFTRFIDHKIIAHKFKKLTFKMQKPDILVVSTPPYDLAYEAVIFAKKKNIPIIVDIRDEWPDLFLTHLPKCFHNIARILLIKEFKMIKYICAKATSLVSMMNSLLNWGLLKAKRGRNKNDKVFYIGAKKSNTSETKLAEEFSNFKKISKNNFVVFFIGTFCRNNDPSIIVDCAKKLLNKNIYFVVAGDGELCHKIKTRTIGLTNVLIPGWLSEAKIISLLKYSHIGVCSTPYTRNAFPNKVFTYLSAGLPTVSAFQGDLKMMIDKYNIGLYYPPNDVNELANCIMRLYDNSELYKEMSDNAKKIFDEKFDADKIYTEYVKHIEKVAVKCKTYNTT
jgi:glycosyltransferase involved in cell wall biosynthesis